MPTTWFFDGSGTDDSCRIMALSAFGGADYPIEEFDRSWRTVLEQFGVEEWHSTDQFRRRNPPPKRALYIALLNAVGEHANEEINAISCAIDKNEVEAIRTLHGDKIPSAEEILLDFCRDYLGAAKEDFGCFKEIKVLFDQKEKFIRHFKEVRECGRAELKGRQTESGGRQKGWPHQIKEIGPASSKDHPALQAADLIGWAIRARYEHGQPEESRIVEITTMFQLAAKLQGGFVDEAAIRARYVDGRITRLSHVFAQFSI
ncbi:MAG: DUF3800 domain-containing protein [Bryobacteraceae bacterium]